MEDEKIVDLYWARSQKAIEETAEKYERYCYRIAWNVLYNHEDCEECISDTWMRAWNSMPSDRPGILSAYLGAITRNLSLDRYRKQHAKKRGGGEVAYVYDELQDVVAGDGTWQQADANALPEVLNRFLGEMEKENRMIFIRRYWYMDSVKMIAEYFDMSESKVKSSLFRSRKKLHTYLQQEGFLR